MNGAHAPEITKKTSKYASFLPAVPVMPPPPKEVCTYICAIHPTHTRTCVPSGVCVCGGGGVAVHKVFVHNCIGAVEDMCTTESVCASPLSCFERH